MKIMFSAAVFALCLIAAKTAIGIGAPVPKKHPSPVLIYAKDSGTIVPRGTVKPLSGVPHSSPTAPFIR